MRAGSSVSEDFLAAVRLLKSFIIIIKKKKTSTLCSRLPNQRRKITLVVSVPSHTSINIHDRQQIADCRVRSRALTELRSLNLPTANGSEFRCPGFVIKPSVHRSIDEI